MQHEELPQLPPGFTRVSGKRAPPYRDQPYYIQLRCGFWSTEVSYLPGQLVWRHDGGSGDIIAVKKA